jgi:hypothetical protein
MPWTGKSARAEPSSLGKAWPCRRPARPRGEASKTRTGSPDWVGCGSTRRNARIGRSHPARRLFGSPGRRTGSSSFSERVPWKPLPSDLTTLRDSRGAKTRRDGHHGLRATDIREDRVPEGSPRRDLASHRRRRVRRPPSEDVADCASHRLAAHARRADVALQWLRNGRDPARSATRADPLSVHVLHEAARFRPTTAAGSRLVGGIPEGFRRRESEPLPYHTATRRVVRLHRRSSVATVTPS